MAVSDAELRDASQDSRALPGRAVVAGTALSVLAVAAVLRFWGLEQGLPHLLARPDEAQVLRHTVLAAQGTFNYDWSIYPHAYVYVHWLWGELVLRLQQLLGFSAPGDYADVWERDPARLYAIGRALSASFGVATVALVMHAARRLSGGLVAGAAGLLLAVCLLHVRDSHALKPDVLMGLGVTAAVIASANLARRRTLAAGVLAGLSVGVAAAAKYNGLIAAAPVCAAAWWGSDARGLRRVLPPPLVVAGLVAAAFFALTSPFVLLNPASVEMWQTTLHAVFPAFFDSPASAGALAMPPIDGPLPPAWALEFGAFGSVVYHFVFSLRYGMGWLPTLIAPLAVIWGLVSRAWLMRVAAVLCLAWYAVTCLTNVMLSRYVTPMIPTLAILEAGLLVAVCKRLAPRHTAAAVTVGALLLSAPMAWSSFQFDRLAARTDTRALATQWLEENTPRGSRIAVVGTRFWHWGAPTLPPGRRLVRPGANPLHPRVADFLVTHDHELFWSSVDPQLLARSARHLEPLIDFDPRAGQSGTPVFERNDAYYIPIHGFDGVSLPGPRVRIYRVR